MLNNSQKIRSEHVQIQKKMSACAWLFTLSSCTADCSSIWTLRIPWCCAVVLNLVHGTPQKHYYVLRSRNVSVNIPVQEFEVATSTVTLLLQSRHSYSRRNVQTELKTSVQRFCNLESVGHDCKMTKNRCTCTYRSETTYIKYSQNVVWMMECEYPPLSVSKYNVTYVLAHRWAGGGDGSLKIHIPN